MSHHQDCLPLTHVPPWLYLGALTVLLLLCMLMAVTWGSANLHAGDVWRVLWHQLPGTGDLPIDNDHRIVWLIRMPRVLLAALVGAGLAMVGLSMQALVGNPLADPYLLGVSSGASVGAVSVLTLGAFALAGFAGAGAITLGAFAGALLATVLVYFLARQRGRIWPTRLILSGVAVAYTLSGVTSLITMTSGQRDLANALMTWTLGSFASTQWHTLLWPSVLLLLGMGVLWLHGRELNALVTGDESATTLGVDTQALRRKLFVLVSLLTGSMVAVSGAIGFVGLVVPHVARMLVGGEHRQLLPLCALLGAIFMVAVDLLARTLFAPMEIPVGVVTSLIGGPFFIWMLLRNTREKAA